MELYFVSVVSVLWFFVLQQNSSIDSLLVNRSLINPANYEENHRKDKIGTAIHLSPEMNVFYVIVNEAEKMLDIELKKVEKYLSFRESSRPNYRPKRSINLKTLSRPISSSPYDDQRIKLSINVNLTLVGPSVELPELSVEDFATLRSSDNKSYVLVAGMRRSLEHHLLSSDRYVTLPVFKLNHDLSALTLIASVQVDGRATKVEAFSIDGVPHFLFVLNAGSDFVDPKIRRSKLYRINSDGTVTTVQTFLTVSSTAWHSFAFRGRTYLAYASYLKYDTSLKNLTTGDCDRTKLKVSTSVKIYEWKGRSFRKTTSVRGTYVTDVDDCENHGRHFFLVANRQQEGAIDTESFVYVYEMVEPDENLRGIQLRLFQKLPVWSPRDIVCVQTDTLYLAIASESRTSGTLHRKLYDSESLLYRFNGLFFVRHQKIKVHGGLKFYSTAVSSSQLHPSVHILQLQSRDHDIYAVAAVENGVHWRTVEPKSLARFGRLSSMDGFGHLAVAVNDRNQSTVISLLRLDMVEPGSRSDVMETSSTCAHAGEQLKRASLSRISLENRVHRVVEKSLAPSEENTFSPVTLPGRWYVEATEKLERIRTDLVDVEREFHSLIGSARNRPYDNTVRHLVLGDVLATSMSASTINVARLSDVHFNRFVEKAVKVVPFSERELSSEQPWMRYSRIVCSSSAYLLRTLNGLAFPRDFALLNGRTNTFAAAHTFTRPTALVMDTLNIRNGKLDGVHVSNVLLVSGDQRVHGETRFAGDVILERCLNVRSGRVDGTNWNKLTRTAVRLDRDSGTVYGQKEFTGSRVAVLGLVEVESGRINGVDVVDMAEHAITVHGTQTVSTDHASPHLHFEDVRFLRSLSGAVTVNGRKLPADFSLLTDEVMKFDSVTLPSLRSESLEVRGKINGLDINGDIMNTHGRQQIFGQLTFAVATASHIRLLQESQNRQSKLAALKTSSVFVSGLVKPEIVCWMQEGSILTYDDNLDTKRIVFHGPVTFSEPLTLPLTPTFVNLVHFEGDVRERLIVPNAADIVFERVEFRAAVSASGSVGGVSVHHLTRNAMFISGHQTLGEESSSSSAVHFKGDLLASHSETVYGTVYGSDFSWTKSGEPVLGVKSELQLRFLDLRKVYVDGTICDVKFSHFIASAVSRTAAQKVFGKKIFTDDVTVQTGNAMVRDRALVNGKDFSHLSGKAVVSGGDFVVSGRLEFVGRLQLANLHADVVDDVKLEKLFERSLLLEETRRLVVDDVLTTRDLQVDRLNDIYMERSLSKAYSTDVYSTDGRFDRLEVKKLVVTGTVNGLKMQDLVHQGLKTVVFRAPKWFEGEVRSSVGFDVQRAFLSSRALVATDFLDGVVVDGDMDVTGSVDGVHWENFKKNAIWIRSGESVRLNVPVHFRGLHIDEGLTELDGLFNGTSLPELLASMVTVDGEGQIVNANLVFTDVTFEGVLTARAIRFASNESRSNVDGDFVFGGHVIVLRDLDIRGPVDGIQLDQLTATTNDLQLTAEKSFDSLQVKDLWVKGQLCGMNVADSSLAGSGIAVTGQQTLIPYDAAACQNVDTSLRLDANVVFEEVVGHDYDGAANPPMQPCSILDSLHSTLKQIPLRLDEFVLVEMTTTGRLLCSLHSNVSVDKGATIVSLKYLRPSHYAVMVETTWSDRVTKTRLPNAVVGTVRSCHAFYPTPDRNELVLVLDTVLLANFRVSVWSSTSNKCISFGHNFQDLMVLGNSSRILLATQRKTGGRIEVAVWSWSSKEKDFVKFQTLKQSYPLVVARFVPFSRQLVVSSAMNRDTSLVSLYAFDAFETRFSALASTIVNVDSATMVAGHHRHETILLFLTENGNLVIIVYENDGDSSLTTVRNVFISEAASKLFLLQFRDHLLVAIVKPHSVNFYDYNGLNDMGKMAIKYVSDLQSISGGSFDYLLVQTKGGDECNLGALSVYQTPILDDRLRSCICDEYDESRERGEPTVTTSRHPIVSPFDRLLCRGPDCRLIGKPDRPGIGEEPLAFHTEASKAVVKVDHEPSGRDCDADNEVEHVTEATMLIDEDADVYASTITLEEFERGVDAFTEATTDLIGVDTEDKEMPLDISTWTPAFLERAKDERVEVSSVFHDLLHEHNEEDITMSTLAAAVQSGIDDAELRMSSVGETFPGAADETQRLSTMETVLDGRAESEYGISTRVTAEQQTLHERLSAATTDEYHYEREEHTVDDSRVPMTTEVFAAPRPTDHPDELVAPSSVAGVLSYEDAYLVPSTVADHGGRVEVGDESWMNEVSTVETVLDGRQESENMVSTRVIDEQQTIYDRSSAATTDRYHSEREEHTVDDGHLPMTTEVLAAAHPTDHPDELIASSSMAGAIRYEDTYLIPSTVDDHEIGVKVVGESWMNEVSTVVEVYGADGDIPLSTSAYESSFAPEVVTHEEHLIALSSVAASLISKEYDDVDTSTTTAHDVGGVEVDAGQGSTARLAESERDQRVFELSTVDTEAFEQPKVRVPYSLTTEFSRLALDERLMLELSTARTTAPHDREPESMSSAVYGPDNAPDEFAELSTPSELKDRLKDYSEELSTIYVEDERVEELSTVAADGVHEWLPLAGASTAAAHTRLESVELGGLSTVSDRQEADEYVDTFSETAADSVTASPFEQYLHRGSSPISLRPYEVDDVKFSTVNDAIEKDYEVEEYRLSTVVSHPMYAKHDFQVDPSTVSTLEDVPRLLPDVDRFRSGADASTVIVESFVFGDHDESTAHSYVQTVPEAERAAEASTVRYQETHYYVHPLQLTTLEDDERSTVADRSDDRTPSVPTLLILEDERRDDEAVSTMSGIEGHHLFESISEVMPITSVEARPKLWDLEAHSTYVTADVDHETGPSTTTADASGEEGYDGRFSIMSTVVLDGGHRKDGSLSMPSTVHISEEEDVDAASPSTVITVDAIAERRLQGGSTMSDFHPTDPHHHQSAEIATEAALHRDCADQKHVPTTQRTETKSTEQQRRSTPKQGGVAPIEGSRVLVAIGDAAKGLVGTTTTTTTTITSSVSQFVHPSAGIKVIEPAAEITADVICDNETASSCRLIDGCEPEEDEIADIEDVDSVDCDDSRTDQSMTEITEHDNDDDYEDHGEFTATAATTMFDEVDVHTDSPTSEWQQSTSGVLTTEFYDDVDRRDCCT